MDNFVDNYKENFGDNFIFKFVDNFGDNFDDIFIFINLRCLRKVCMSSLGLRDLLANRSAAEWHQDSSTEQLPI